MLTPINRSRSGCIGLIIDGAIRMFVPVFVVAFISTILLVALTVCVDLMPASFDSTKASLIVWIAMCIGATGGLFMRGLASTAGCILLALLAFGPTTAKAECLPSLHAARVIHPTGHISWGGGCYFAGYPGDRHGHGSRTRQAKAEALPLPLPRPRPAALTKAPAPEQGVEQALIAYGTQNFARLWREAWR